MRTLLEDLRYALRHLGKAPAFTVVAVLTLAIGIGANTAIFSLVHTVLLRPLDFREPERLVRLYETEAAPGKYPFAGPDYADWKAQNHTFTDMTFFGWPRSMNLSGTGQPDRVRALPTEANFFQLLGVEPMLGRTWASGEDQPGRDRVVVLSYALWTSRFAADPRVVGRTLLLDAEKYTIVGVMPANFRYTTRAQMWVPMDMSSKGLGQRGSHWASAIGRLKPGVTVQQAQADLSVIAARLEKQFPDSNDKVGAKVVPLHEDLIGRSRDALWMMLSAVGLVLLIACANVANLLLARSVARQKEMAVRSALGAGRWRLIRQLLTESLTLSLAGGVLGTGLAWGLIAAFADSKSVSIPRFSVIHLDARVLAFTFALAVLTGALFGIIPAWRTSRPDLHDELKGGAGSAVSPSRRRRFTSDLLVVAEMALSLVLLASAGLLLKDFTRVRGIDVGVRTAGVWTAEVQLPKSNYEEGAPRARFAEALLARAERIPGVDAATISTRLPVEGGGNYYIQLRGQTVSTRSSQLVESHEVTPDYFRALGVKLLKGRLLTATDVERARELDDRARQAFADGARPPQTVVDSMVYPVVVNQAMVRAFWPAADPLGQMYTIGGGPWRQVVGVVGDVRSVGLTQRPVPEAYDAFTGGSGFYLVLHTTLPPAGLTGEVRRQLAGLDPNLALSSVRTMDDVIDENAQSQRFLGLLVTSFAALATLLAAIGIYGVLAYMVTQRTREIGIRMALGASRGRVLGQVLGQGALLALWGAIAGLAGALGAGRMLASLLNEVRPGDPLVLGAAAGVLAAVALLACYLPARRAARLEPVDALRCD